MSDEQLTANNAPEPLLIHEGKEFLIITKPAGLLMHGLPNKMVQEPLLTDWLTVRYPELKKVGDDPAARPGLVHRLDRGTSGILLVARTQAFFERAKQMFQTHEIRKTYVALVRGHLERPRGVIEKPIGIKSGTTLRSVRSSRMRKSALTEYHLLEHCVRSGDVTEEPGFKSSLVEALPRTGRTHQIRVHFTAIGHPVLGDLLYGPSKQPSWVTRLMLHALALEFTGPEGEVLRFTAPLDAEFLAIMRAAGASRKA